MRIAARLARRDLSRGGQGLLLLAACLFLGVAALAGIGSLSASLLAALDAQGRTLLGGDVELRVSQRRATVAERDAFARAGRVSEVVSMRAMAGAGAGTGVGAGGDGGAGRALIELRGVDDAWPLVGRFRLAPGALAARPRGPEVAIAPALAGRLRAGVGSSLQIGTGRFRVIGLIAEEPDRLGAGFALGPPVIVDPAGLDRTGLVRPGSLFESRYRMVLPNPTLAEPTGDRLVARFRDAGWSARTRDDAAGGLRRTVGQLGQFLLLVGLSALAIAGVGIGGGVSAYLAGKTRTAATLKVLGAEAGTVARLFLFELAAVGGAGVAGGLALGAAVPWIVAGAAGAALPVQPRLALYPLPLVTAALLALLVALLAALPALARVRRVPAATLLRDAVAEPVRPSRRTIGAIALLAGALAALAILSSRDRVLAAGFVAAVAALLALLWAIGVAVRRGLARAPRPRGTLARMALANLHRPGAATDRLVVALGLGFSLFVALATIDTSLSAELASTAPAKAPRLIAIDLPPDAAGRFRAAVRAAAPGARIEAVPSLRGAISALNGRRVADMKTLPEGAWVLRGDRTLTWSARLPARNQVAAGRWWPAAYRGPPLVSLEDSAARALGLRIGDTVTVTVLGVDVPARLAATRRIDWGSLGLNFAIVFSPGYIEEAPHSLLASVYAPPARDGAIAARVAAALPSVTLIRVGDVIAQVADVMRQVAIAIRVAAGATVAAGIAVLVGAVAATGRARRYDAVILKLLGGRARQVLAVQAIEYLALSAVLALVALLVGGGAGWFVVTRVFSLAWAPDWGVVGATLAAGMAATAAVGLIGSVGALRARPATVLRAL